MISVIQMIPVVLRVTFALLEVLMIMKVVLKFVMITCGEQCVMISGVQMMEEWLVVN